MKMTVNQENKGNTKSKREHIFSWHNGLMLQEQLNELTNENFKLKETENFDDYTFVNSLDEVVKVNLEGYVVSSDIYIPAIFQARARKRLSKTKEMLSMFNS